MAEVCFIDAAVEDLLRLNHDIRLRVLKKVMLLEHNPKAGQPLGGPLTGYRKLVVGNRDWRIVYRETTENTVEICEVWVVGARADDEVYREAIERVNAAPTTPTVRTLRDVLERLGHQPPPAPPEPDPLPSWLVERLVRTAGLPPDRVAAMTLEDAFDAWTNYQTQPPTDSGLSAPIVVERSHDP